MDFCVKVYFLPKCGINIFQDASKKSFGYAWDFWNAFFNVKYFI